MRLHPPTVPLRRPAYRLRVDTHRDPTATGPYLDASTAGVLAFAHRGGAYHPDIEGLENTLAAFRTRSSWATPTSRPTST